MTLPVKNLVAPLIAEPTTWLVGPIASTYKSNETLTVYNLKNFFEVDSAGNPTTYPLGTSGPFVLKVDNEQILCSAADYFNNKVYIYSSSAGNGRGYNGTTIAAHQTGGYGSDQVSLVSTSTQSVLTQLQALGFASSIGGSIAETIPRMFVSGNLTLTSSQLRTTAVYLYAGQVISNITFATYTTAGATVTGTWGGLFTSNAGYSTFTLVAATAQQSVSSLAASSYFTWPIATIASGASSTYTVPTTGIYYIGVCITATTMPTVTGLFMAPAANGGTAPPLQAGTLTGSTNPASIGTTYTVSGSSSVVYYALT
jgi:hypothetical protein